MNWNSIILMWFSEFTQLFSMKIKKEKLLASMAQAINWNGKYNREQQEKQQQQGNIDH